MLGHQGTVKAAWVILTGSTVPEPLGYLMDLNRNIESFLSLFCFTGMSLVWDPSLKEQSWEGPGPEWKARARTFQQVFKMLPEPT